MEITKARLIQDVDGATLRTEFAIENLIDAMEVRGYKLSGVTTARGQRAELVGQPRFTGVVGPMWGGDHLRYETQAVYAECSR